MCNKGVIRVRDKVREAAGTHSSAQSHSAMIQATTGQHGSNGIIFHFSLPNKHLYTTLPSAPLGLGVSAINIFPTACLFIYKE